jgi:hypothetical protein
MAAAAMAVIVMARREEGEKDLTRKGGTKAKGEREKEERWEGREGRKH